MPVYEYTALDAKGKTTSGIIDADGARAARQKLRASGIFPVAIKESQEAPVKKASRTFDLSRYLTRVKPAEIAIMTRQLATLISAGFPLVSAIDALVPQTKSHRLKTILAQVKDAIVEGQNFAQALSQYPGIFSPLFINMVRAGETSGTLEIVLERLADIDGDPLVFGGGVFAATYQGNVAAVEQRSGRIAWRRQMSSYAGMAADREGLYVADADGVVWGLDIRGGNVVWKQEALTHRNLSNVATLGGLVVVGDFEGYLHWLDRRDGSMIARTRVGRAPITTGLQAVDGVLYVQSDGGDLAAVRLPQ